MSHIQCLASSVSNPVSTFQCPCTCISSLSHFFSHLVPMHAHDISIPTPLNCRNISGHCMVACGTTSRCCASWPACGGRVFPPKLQPMLPLPPSTPSPPGIPARWNCTCGMGRAARSYFLKERGKSAKCMQTALKQPPCPLELPIGMKAPWSSAAPQPLRVSFTPLSSPCQSCHAKPYHSAPWLGLWAALPMACMHACRRWGAIAYRTCPMAA